MSNEMKDLLHGAAASPSGPPDVPGAWRRGRRMRVQRRALSGLAIVAVVALGSLAVADIVPNGGSSVPPATQAPAPAICSAPNTSTPIPSWARSAHPPAGVPRLLSSDGNVLAVLFSAPLSSPPGDRGDKILWIVRLPRDGKPLVITATLPGTRAVHLTFPANSGPGEIYPSGVEMPKPGCWHFVLAWNGHGSSMNLRYVAPPPTDKETAPATFSTTPTTSTTSTVAPTTAPPTTCATAHLALTLGPQIGSAGHFNYELQLRNVGSVACTMTGFPGVSFLDSSGSQIGVPAQRNTLTYSTVTIAPGATAYAHLAIVDTSVQNCPAAAAHEIRVYPPNETSSLTVALSGLQVCSNQTPGATIDPVLDHSLS
jgi:Protein of unknown function (DUF4232)